MIITISGTPGSGKSTLAQMLARKLHAKRIYVGGMRRQLAKEKKMTLEELNEYAKTHPETDIDVDKAAANEARTLERQGKLVLVEGRVQYHFLPESLKIYIKVAPEEAAKRIWGDLQNKERKEKRNEGQFQSLAEVKKMVIERPAADAARYKKYYHLDHRDEKQYDFVLDTTNLQQEEALEKILQFIKSKKKPEKSISLRKNL